MRTLVLITSHFPFGNGESFIGTELPFLSEEFEKIIIISQDVTGEQTRDIPVNTIVCRYNTTTTLTGFFYLPVIFILHSREIIRMIRDEITFRLRIDKNFTFGRFLHLFKKVLKAFQLNVYIKKTLDRYGIEKNIVFYSYWLKTGAHAICLTDYPGSIKISRAHGSDIYEERTESRYLPLLEFASMRLDAVCFISENGKKYFSEKTLTEKAGFIVSRLGIENPFSGKTMGTGSKDFTIVSCSNMIPLKRIDLIIKALEILKTAKEIHWMHFGDGILKNDLRELADKRIGKSQNIKYNFMGHYPNAELLKFYSLNRIDLFINTSSTEGIPVSIMEAQSAGIPVIATNVGGVSEIVVEGTGSLLQPDFHISELAGLIKHYAELSWTGMDTLRLNSINNWNRNYKASRNYSGFIRNINSIFASATSKRG